MNQSSKTCWIIHTDTSINIASLGLAVHWNYDLFMLEMDIRQWPVRWKNGIFCFLYTIAFLCIFCFHFCTQIKSNVWCSLFRSSYCYGNSKPIFGHFFAKHIYIFHKTEVQTVILSCSTYLNLNCIKSYNRKHKNVHFPFL